MAAYECTNSMDGFVHLSKRLPVEAGSCFVLTFWFDGHEEVSIDNVLTGTSGHCISGTHLENIGSIIRDDMKALPPHM